MAAMRPPKKVSPCYKTALLSAVAYFVSKDTCCTSSDKESKQKLNGALSAARRFGQASAGRLTVPSDGCFELLIAPKKKEKKFYQELRRKYKLSYSQVKEIRRYIDYNVKDGGAAKKARMADRGTLDPRLFSQYVPLADVRKIGNENLARLDAVNKRLHKVLRLRGGARTYKPDARDSNRGHSLGRTVVSGGGGAFRAGQQQVDAAAAAMARARRVERAQRTRRANRRAAAADRRFDISGTMHINKNLQKHQELQEEITSVLRDIVFEAYGSAPWFRAVLKAVKSSIPSERLLPGRGADLPISHIWRAFSPKAYHTHTDFNTCVAAFAVQATQGVVGGDLCVTPQKGMCYNISTDYGKIIGGRWAIHAHCNELVYKGDREVYILYLDKRVCDHKYVNQSSDLTNSQVLFSEEEKLAMAAIRDESEVSKSL